MRGERIACTTKLAFFVEQCPACAVLFGVPDDLHTRIYKSGGAESLYCPNGHGFSWAESEADKLRRERDRLKQQIAQKDDEISGARFDTKRAREEAEHQRHRADGYKGHATRLRKRASAGVCPCCNRSFENLRRHMAAKHPKFEPVLIEGGKVA